MTSVAPSPAFRAVLLGRALLPAILLTVAAAAPSAASPFASVAGAPIRIGPGSQVPACVTPAKLMAFLATRNDRLDARYRDIAHLYKQHGEMWRVRWDYAFFQMVVETNYLLFRRGDGTPGDVKPAQNNFAGVGTTGGGVPGDSYPDVSTGVLAQIHHLVVYSGERVERPVGARTQKVQDDVLSFSTKIAAKRPVTYQDLAGRWAADRRYGRTMEAVADRFRAMFCTGQPAVEVAETRVPPPMPAARPAVRLPPATAAVPASPPRAIPPAVASTVAPSAPAASGPNIKIASVRPVVPPQAAAVRDATPLQRADIVVPRPVEGPRAARADSGCKVQTASFGGRKTVLIGEIVKGEPHFTAVQVLDGFEASMAESFMRAHAPTGARLGEFASKEAAVERAWQLCGAGSR